MHRGKINVWLVKDGNGGRRGDVMQPVDTRRRCTLIRGVITGDRLPVRLRLRTAQLPEACNSRENESDTARMSTTHDACRPILKQRKKKYNSG